MLSARGGCRGEEVEEGQEEEGQEEQEEVTPAGDS
jgi:hypothetical protein